MNDLRFLLYLFCIALAIPSLSAAQDAADDGLPESPRGNPDEIRRGLRMGGQDGKSREQVMYERIISKVEPGLKGDPEKLQVYVDLFKREMVNDQRFFATDVKADSLSDGTIKLSGHVMFEENKRSLLKLFEHLGFTNVEDAVEVLPSAALGEKKYAFVVVPHAFAYDKPTTPRETMTDSYIGDRIWLLKPAENDHYLVAAGDGYIGYMAADALLPVTEEEFTAYQEGDRAVFRRDLREDGIFIPAGSNLKLADRSRRGRAVVALPSGAEVPVQKTLLTVKEPTTPEEVERALEVAKSKLGSDYVWGGKTSEGVDCSGLVQSSYKAQGITLPRDAYMQAYVGNLVATRWYPQGMKKGDMMFFLGGNGKINHVAMYWGDGQFIEAAGRVKFSSLNPEDDNYDARRAKSFCFAKRLRE